MAFYTCSVCGRKRGNVDKKEQLTFQIAPNGERICHWCIDERDRATMKKKQRITLHVCLVDGHWHVRNASGRIDFRLESEMGMPFLSALDNPCFKDEDGKLWRGRIYLSSSTAHFVRLGKARSAKKLKGGGVPRVAKAKARD